MRSVETALADHAMTYGAHIASVLQDRRRGLHPLQTVFALALDDACGSVLSVFWLCTPVACAPVWEESQLVARSTQSAVIVIRHLVVHPGRKYGACRLVHLPFDSAIQTETIVITTGFLVAALGLGDRELVLRADSKAGEAGEAVGYG